MLTLSIFTIMLFLSKSNNNVVMQANGWWSDIIVSCTVAVHSVVDEHCFNPNCISLVY